MKILSVSCSPRKPSHSMVLARLIEEAAEKSGAEIDRLNLSDTPLPMMSLSGHGDQQPFVDEVKARMKAAEGFIVVSPEYHGSMSGPAKNFFDHGYHEFSGKLFAIAAATGGSQGISCLTHMRATIQYCHGWTLPYQVGARTVEFDDNHEPNEKVRERLALMGRDLVAYGRLMFAQYKTDASNPELKNESFAGWHAHVFDS